MYFRFQLAIASVFCLTLLSCDNGSKTDREIIKAMEESLNSSNQRINSSSQMMLASLEDKVSDPFTSVRAKIWFQKAQKIRELSSEFNDYLYQLKKEEKASSKKASLLLKKMKELGNSILNTDSLIRRTFESPEFTNNFIDSTYTSGEVFYNRYFKGTSKGYVNAFLSTLQNNTKVFENKLISFCHEQVPRYGHYYDFSTTIVGQSSELVEPGKEMKIKAGVGTFSKFLAKSQVKVNGKDVPINDYGVSEYSFKAPKTPGKYSIPVKISYTDQEGKEQIIETRIKYTVAKICNE